MNIPDIENTLNRILKYNKNLDYKGLELLLEASDWDDSDRKDALFIFKRDEDLYKSGEKFEQIKEDKPKEIKPQIKEEQEVNTEEELLPSAEINSDHLLDDGLNDLDLEEPKEIVETNKNNEIFKDNSKDINVDSEDYKKNKIKKILDRKIENLPDSLPVVPFESSPHAIRFDEYTENFYEKDDIKSNLKVSETESYKKVVRNYPLSKQDKSLLWTASIFLVVILVLLFYVRVAGRV